MATIYVDSGGSSTNSGSSDNNSPDLSGTGTLTLVSSKTISAVDTAADTVTVTGHGYTTGWMCTVSNSGGALPGGLAAGTYYWVRNVGADTISFHTSRAGAEAGTGAVNLTSAGSGTNTVNNCTVSVSGSPDFSGVKVTYMNVTASSDQGAVAGGVHGLSTGDTVYLYSVLVGGAGLSARPYSVRAVSTTAVTFHPSRTDADANTNAVNITSDGAVLLITDVNSTIYVAEATNATNKKIFLIVDCSDSGDWLSLDTSPTGITGSDWAIGGRTSSIVNAFDALQTAVSTATVHQGRVIAGSRILVNNDQSYTTAPTMRQGPPSGGNAIAGPTLVKGVGDYPKLTQTSTGNVIAGTASWWMFEHLEMRQQGASGNMFANATINLYDCKVTDNGGQLISNGALNVTRCEISGINGSLVASNNSLRVTGCWIHDVVGQINQMGQNLGYGTMMGNLIERCASAVGSPATDGSLNDMSIFAWNTVYRCTSHGYRGTYFQPQWIFSNIFKDNGNAATEYNFTPFPDFDRYDWAWNNCFNVSGGLGGTNLLNHEVNADEITTDPQFVDPDNGTAASRNFGLKPGSPARGTGWPGTFPGSTGTVGYADMGAVQRREPVPLIGHGMVGGMRG